MIMKHYCKDLKEKHSRLLHVSNEFHEKLLKGKSSLHETLRLKEELPVIIKEARDSVYQYEFRDAIAKSKGYSYVGAFKEGIAVACWQKAEKYFYIDTAGNRICEPGLCAEYRSSKFVDGIGIVSDPLYHRKYFVDKNGTKLFGEKEAIVNASEFHEGWASVHDEGGWYYISRDFQTKIRIPKEFSQFVVVSLGNFENGIACILLRKDQYSYSSVYIDEHGREVQLPGLEEAERAHVYRHFNDNLTIIDISDEGSVIYNRKTGKKVYLNIFRVSDFSEDCAVGTVTKSKINEGMLENYDMDFYITPDGKNMFGDEIYFASAYPFSEGLAAVMKNPEEKYYYINKQGRKAFDKGFFEANPFDHGIAWVRDESGKDYCIDKNGNPAFDDINFKVDGYVEDFIDGVAEVYVGKDRVFIDRRGRKMF